MKKYQVTKKQCQTKIDKFNNVCDRCGKKLKPIKTVDNSGNPTFWSGCFHGEVYGHLTGGVKKELFLIAKKLVSDGEIYYCSMKKCDYNTSGEKLYWIQSQISGFCKLLRKIEYIKDKGEE